MRNYLKLLFSEQAYFYIILIVLTLSRVLTTKIQACPLEFDCNAYIKMSHSLAFDASLLGHHAMRILPSFLAGLLQESGLSIENSFRLLSDSAYVIFGLLTFWILRRWQVKPWLALGFTLLCLAPHHSMRIPLQLVYQTCDIFTYPLALLLIYFSLQKNAFAIFILSLISIMTKQTLVVLSVGSLLYCYWPSKEWRCLAYAALVILSYLLLQMYYQAGGVVTNHLIPAKDFFSFTHWGWIVIDSQLLELFIPIVPLFIYNFKSLFFALFRYWHIGLYIGAVVGQPFIGYHLTGNNFARLALQGIWIIYLLIAMQTVKQRWSNASIVLLVIYAMVIYFTWKIPERIVLMMAFSLVALIFCFMQKSSSLTIVDEAR